MGGVLKFLFEGKSKSHGGMSASVAFYLDQGLKSEITINGRRTQSTADFDWQLFSFVVRLLLFKI
jgi:hypothetical protein